MILIAYLSIGIWTVISNKPNLKKTIGSGYNVTHLGFFIKDKGRVVFRHAAQDQGVLDIGMYAYTSKRVGQRVGNNGILGYCFYSLSD